MRNFTDIDNSFFGAILYGIMFYKSEGKILERGKAVEVLEVDFYNELLEIKDEAQLGRTIFRYFDTCFKVNNVPSNYNFFLKFFERRDVFSFLIQKQVQEKIKQDDKKPFQFCC